MAPHTSTPDDPGWEELVDAVVAASRALVAIAARSLAGRSDDVTLPQYRVLVVLTSRGPQRIVDLAQQLGVNPSTATRMCDRLERKQLVVRQPVPDDRRAIRLAATAGAHELVSQVMTDRRAEIGRILAAMPTARHREITGALRQLAEAAGELPEPETADR